MDNGTLKFLFKHSSIYGLGTIFSQAVGFFLLPLYTRYLSPSDYGVAALIETTLALIGIVLGLGIGNGLMRFYHESENEKDKNRVVSTCYWTAFALSVISVLFLIGISKLIGEALFKSTEYVPHITVAVIASALGFIMEPGMIYMRIKKRSTRFVMISMTNTLVMIGLNIYFLAVLQIGLIGIFYSMLIARGAISVALTIAILREVRLGFSAVLMWEMIQYSFPMTFTHIFRVVAQESDKYFINYFFSPFQTGLYTISQKIGTVVHSLITVPFLASYVPKQFEIMHEKNAGETYATVLNYYLLVIVSTGLALSVFANEILTLMATETYYSAAAFIPMVVLSWIVFGSKYHFEIGMLIQKKTKYIAYVNAGSAGVNVALNYLLIPPLNIWGAVISLNAACLFSAALNCCLSQRLYKIHFDWKFIFKLGLISFLIFLLSTPVRFDSIYFSILLKMGLLLVYIGLLVWQGVLEKGKIKVFGKYLFNSVFPKAAG